MNAVDFLRDKALEYELQAEHHHEHLPDGLVLPDRFGHALQEAVCLGVARTLRELAELEEMREAA